MTLLKGMAFCLITALAIPSRASENPPPCDRNDSACLVRAALTYKYRADAFQAENEMLRQENDALRQNPAPSMKVTIILIVVGAAMFGSLYTASKALR